MIKMAKLISGEIIIGEVIEEKIKDITKFKNLLQVYTAPNGNDQKSIKFSFALLHPFYDLSELIEIKDNHILMWIKPLESIENSYKQKINPSSIVTPIKKLII